MDGGAREVTDMVDGFVDYVYTDPPWGDGNLKFWHTLNRKATGQDLQAPSEDAFLRALFGLFRRVMHSQTVIFIEYSLTRVNAMLNAASLFKLVPVTRLATTAYRSGKKLHQMHACILANAGTVELPAAYMDAVDGTSGMATLYALTSRFDMKGASILDPCCGIGNTARLALDKGMTFYGNELNAARLAKTRALLARAV